jgi:hypothetical protein
MPARPHPIDTAILLRRVCSGQSNMALSVQMALNSTAELAAIDAFGPSIRFIKVGGSSPTPQRDIVPAQVWQRVSAAGMGQSGFSGFRQVILPRHYGACHLLSSAIVVVLQCNVLVYWARLVSSA